jgi:hypothetical protein
MNRSALFTLLLLFLTALFGQAFAQGPTQTIRGTVLDKQSEIPLIGANVELVSIDPVIGLATDTEGRFVLENVPVGRQVIAVSYIGYETITIPNILVTSGKEVILDVELSESVLSMDEVVVTAEVEKDRAENEMATISARTFSVEEVMRYSGGRSDVARLASNFAGVSTADDSRNDIVIRGNSPTGVLWRLEGIPIPNPNHFSTLGTTGGPVSALNPNLLKNSDFLTSAFPSEYGNALAGVFDLGFRKGNRDKHEFMVQLGAVSGLEFMAEGPINRENGSSFLVSGRYSFVGIASELGFPIGTNATPDYQDLAFKVDLGNSKLGRFTLFGIGGRSNIDFLHDEVDEEDLFAGADEDAFPRSILGVVGVKHNIIIDNSTYVRTVLGASTSQNEFTQDRYFNLDEPDEYKVRLVKNDNIETRYTLSSYINRKFDARLTARAGILAEYFDYNITLDDKENQLGQGVDPREVDFITVYDFNEGTSLLQAFVQTQYRFSSKWTLNTGLHSQYFSLNESFALEPRVALNWDFAPKQTLNLGYGLHHQTQPLPVLLLEEPMTGIQSNRDLNFTRSNHFVLGYDVKFAPSWRGKVEAYYQAIDQVPVEPSPSSFSMLNAGNDFAFPDDVFGLINEGTGTNYGVEFTLEKFYSDGYYGLLTATIYDSRYEGSDEIERNTAFNNGYVLNLLFGKEWNIGKDKRNAFSIDTRLTTAGGRYYTPVDLEASKAAGTEVLQEELAFSEQLDPYFRWDLKFGIKLNSKKRKLSHQFYMDIQNVLNNQNLFARRYNRQTNQVNEVYQLGFFPDFMYRIQF